MNIPCVRGLMAFLMLGGTAVAGPGIASSLTGDLVVLQGKKVGRYDAAQLAQTKYFGIYYSAHWCPPCRQFTPKLVEWYNQQKPANPHFELIFVSSDRSEADMEQYIVGDKMPWPAVKFAKKDGNKAITKYSGNGIPCLVLIDAEGKVLSDSYVDGKYVGPGKVMSDITTILAANPSTGGQATPAAATTGTATSPVASPKGSNFDDFFKKKTP